MISLPPPNIYPHFCMVCGHTQESVQSYPAYYGANSTQRMQLCKLHTQLFSRYWMLHPPSQRTLSTIRRFIEYEKLRIRLVEGMKANG